jgi:hypothetical protein
MLKIPKAVEILAFSGIGTTVITQARIGGLLGDKISENPFIVSDMV